MFYILMKRYTRFRQTPLRPIHAVPLECGEEDLALVDLKAPGLVSNPGVHALDLAGGRDIAIIRAMEEQHFF
jgi:hypothetical protein